MKIFLSYGHGDHVKLVNRLFDFLKEEGHTPWKDDRYEDRGGIGAGADFTDVIFKEIDESDFVIAFVTARTVGSSYCRDERQRAYNKQGNRFIQIRLDKTDITLGCARNYIDMDDVEDSNGNINEEIFQLKMDSLRVAFNDPDAFADAGERRWAKINAHLQVEGAIKFNEFAHEPHIEFFGREWLVKRCEEWVLDDSQPCRLFAIFGDAGTGKTEFVRHICNSEKLVRSAHICKYDKIKIIILPIHPLKADEN